MRRLSDVPTLEIGGFGLVLLARVVLASSLGLGRDEAAYWYASWNGLAAGYSPVTGVLIRVSTSLFGDGAFAIRLPGLLAGAAGALVLVVLARALGASRRMAWLAGIALAASPWQGYAGTVAHPDAFLLLFVLLFAWGVCAARGPAHPSRGLALACAAAGLAALAKLPGALLFAPATWMLWKRRRERGFGFAAALLGVFAALVLISLDLRILSGVLEFGSFDSNLDSPTRLGLAILEITLLAGPAFLALAALGVLDVFRRREIGVLSATAALLVGFFAVFLGSGQAKGNWFLPGFALLLPLGAVAWARAPLPTGLARHLAGSSVAVSSVLAILWALPAHPGLWARVTAADWLRPLDATYSDHAGERERRVSPTRSWTERFSEYHGEDDLDGRVAAAFANGRPVLVSNDYGLAFSMARRVGREARVILPWDPIFSRTCEQRPGIGEDAIFVSRNWSALPSEWAARFQETVPLQAGETGDPSLVVVACRGFSPEEVSQVVSTR